MDGKCTLFFEDPFWVAVFERTDENGYSLARHVFGSEPSEAQFYQFILQGYGHLEFSPPGPLPAVTQKELSFKRRQREARRQVEAVGVGTWAQRALQAEHDRRKTQDQVSSRLERQEQAAAQYQRKKEQHKQKHRGR